MNRSKLLSASALASVMAASAAHAEMSISGYTLGAFYDSDGGGLANANTSTVWDCLLVWTLLQL